MIPYFEELEEREKEEVTGIIRQLYRQTYILEKKYDRRTERFKLNREYRSCEKHAVFLKEYFQIAGVELKENAQSGVFYILGESAAGSKLSRLATFYVLLLKLIYDEQMSTASTSIYVSVTMEDVNERLGSFQLLKQKPAMTELRNTLSTLKKYQLIEVLDPLNELEPGTRIIIYPSINAVLFGEDIRAILENFGEEEDGEEEISGSFEDVSE